MVLMTLIIPRFPANASNGCPSPLSAHVDAFGDGKVQTSASAGIIKKRAIIVNKKQNNI
jgi:hypothetical protein